jgi:LDH2 family malate/lactate/ureidoglycolate dehydrogenase
MAFKSRNYPPEHGILVPIEHQGGVIRRLLATTAMRLADADYLTERLLANDARSLYSHGSKQLRHYLENLRDGNVNPEPDVRIVSNFGAVASVDGDGGLGYMACRVGMAQVLKATHEFGMGACTTSNHFHIGSAGAWTRMAVEQGFVGMAMSAHRNRPDPNQPVSHLPNSSPISIGFPAGSQPPFILDMGGAMLPYREDLIREMPNSYFKALGISTAIQVFSGVLAGINRERLKPPQTKWTSNQGAFLCAWDVKRFMDLEEYTAEMDHFIEGARQMQPFPGFDRAELPGGMEWQWERENRERGIPLGDENCEELEVLAAEVGVECGYDQFEVTRF